MAVKLYLGVEGVLLQRVDRIKRKARGFEAMPYALEFLTWCVSRFDCYWLTRLDRCGGNNRIRRAFRIAWNEWQLPGELEIIFEAVIPTVWEDAKIEGIDLDSDFYWIESDPDPECLAFFKRRGLGNRLLIYEQPDDLWKFACQLGPLGEKAEMW